MEDKEILNNLIAMYSVSDNDMLKIKKLQKVVNGKYFIQLSNTYSNNPNRYKTFVYHKDENKWIYEGEQRLAKSYHDYMDRIDSKTYKISTPARNNTHII